MVYAKNYISNCIKFQLTNVSKLHTMKFNTKLPKVLKPYFEEEIVNFESAFSKNDYVLAFQHLENAHIIGQAYPFAHTFVHWKMLHFGIKIKNTKEVIGQIPRLIFGGIKSFIDVIPTGNTGGANVSALKPMPIRPELQRILNLLKNESI